MTEDTKKPTIQSDEEVAAPELLREMDVVCTQENLRRARAPSILSCILPFYLMILLRGSLLQAMSFLFAILGCAVFVSRWERISPR